jgi:predicted ATP-grasp superfamily ATP-dependent carboligase
VSVLVLDADARSALAAVRSLGARGIPVFTADATARSLAGCSRYSRGYYRLPSAVDAPSDFVRAVLRIADELDVDVIFPMVDASVMLLCDAVPADARPIIAAPSGQAYRALSDKAALLEVARDLGIRAPRTTVVHSADALREAAYAMGFPCILKPANSRLLLKNRIVGTSVELARNEADIEAVANSAWLGPANCLVQEFIPGTGAGVFAMYDRSGPTAWFAHRRLREKPPSGGVSTLSESVAVNPELRALSERMLSAVNWFGPAMIEFRVDPKGQPWLMEVNGRFWGSLQLAIDSGVDFPWLLYQHCLGHGATAPTTYDTGRQLRWLLGDFDHLLLQLRGKGTAMTLMEKLAVLCTFLSGQGGKSRFEILRRDDPGPFRYELRRWFRDLAFR